MAAATRPIQCAVVLANVLANTTALIKAIAAILNFRLVGHWRRAVRNSRWNVMGVWAGVVVEGNLRLVRAARIASNGLW